MEVCESECAWVEVYVGKRERSGYAVASKLWLCDGPKVIVDDPCLLARG
jgi:hypothetical protein